MRPLPFGDISDIFREVEAGSCQYGVVPVENSTEGVISHTLDMFMRSPLRIAGEVSLRIHHHLMSREPDLEGVRTVFSHQQSLAQCRGWLDRHLPNAERIAVGSNAEAARLAAAEAGAAAVAGEAAAEIYELQLLADRIEDEPGNTTRFLVIAKRTCRRAARQDQPAAFLPQRVGWAPPTAQSARRARHQHDAHRVPSLQAGHLGLCLLHRHLGHRSERSSPRPLKTGKRITIIQSIGILS